MRVADATGGLWERLELLSVVSQAANKDSLLQIKLWRVVWGHPPPLPSPTGPRVSLLAAALKQAFAGMEAGASDYLSDARSAGASGEVTVFLSTCVHSCKPQCHVSPARPRQLLNNSDGGGAGPRRGMFRASFWIIAFLFLSDRQIKHSDIDTIPAANGEGAAVARLFCPREPEVVVDQYSADIDATPVVICSRTLWLQTFLR